MCGISGYLSRDASLADPRQTLESLVSPLAHRGPDAEGSWLDPEGHAGLGHRRLSIIDLSASGAQPMTSASGRYVIAFNGEVYNYQQLREEVERADLAPRWRGTSDTEVLLACIAAWGVPETLTRLNAMFAFALWDRESRTLHLARDRFGEKPLYYGRVGSAIVFASELKSIRRFPGFDGTLDREALGLFFQYAYVPTPRTIYRDIRKLPAGHLLSIPVSSADVPEPVPYWRPSALTGSKPRRSDSEWVDALDDALRQSVKLRSIADVPLGAFLSGGIDSTAVVAAMQAQSRRAVKTFTIGNHAGGYDEAAHAREVARHLGTDHTELYVTAADALDVIPSLPSMYDEPFADSSAIPTFLVSRLARHHVTVALSGDGGDEMFGGYNRHFHGAHLWQRFGRLPRFLRSSAASVLSAISPRTWNAASTLASGVLPRELSAGRAGEKIHKFARSLRARSEADFYDTLLSAWDREHRLLAGERVVQTLNDTAPPLATFAERMMFSDMVGYLPDDILVKVDRASMAVSLEARVPFLDPQVAELAWSMPLDQKTSATQGKVVLRRLVDRYVPRSLMDRPKQGFQIPIAAWLRSELRDWAEELLSEERIEREGILQAAPIRKVWLEHLSGRCNNDTRLWTVLMFQSWLEAQRVGAD